MQYDSDAMKGRLRTRLDTQGLSLRAASIRAGLAKGYLHSILKEGREPTVQNLAKVCAANDISLAYVLLGFEVSSEVCSDLQNED